MKFYINLYIIILFLLIINIPTIAQNTEADSLNKIVRLPEVQVIKERNKSNSAIEFSPNTTIDNQIIQTISPTQISEVMSLAPGVNISNYGGLESMKTISIRGTGSMRTLILLDGLPINSSQNGSFDLNNINPSLIDNIEIIRGGASAIYGGNAIGGAVNIQTNYSPSEIIKANIRYGSFNEIETNITGNYVANQTLLSTNINYQTSDGNYPFNYTLFGEEKLFYRENADYKNLMLSGTAKTNFYD
jgi:outer membrane cobalamin receptor